jgi:hypothetical protein
MERFEYKGHVVEIFTTKKGGGWTWAFTVDAWLAEANKVNDFETASFATYAAKEKARNLIDKQS